MTLIILGRLPLTKRRFIQSTQFTINIQFHMSTFHTHSKQYHTHFEVIFSHPYIILTCNHPNQPRFLQSLKDHSIIFYLKLLDIQDPEQLSVSFKSFHHLNVSNQLVMSFETYSWPALDYWCSTRINLITEIHHPLPLACRILFSMLIQFKPFSDSSYDSEYNYKMGNNWGQNCIFDLQ